MVFEGQAGLIFLSTPPATFVRLMLAPDGSYSIETLSQGNDSPAVLVPRTTHQALRRGAGALNQVTVERNGTTIQFSANGQPLTDFTIPAGEYLNQYGFAITSPSGQARAIFDTIVGERISD